MTISDVSSTEDLYAQIANAENLHNFKFQLRVGAMKKKVERSGTLSLRECGIENENTISVFPCGGLLGGSGRGAAKRGRADQKQEPEDLPEPPTKVGTSAKNLTKRTIGNSTTLFQSKETIKQQREEKSGKNLTLENISQILLRTTSRNF